MTLHRRLFLRAGALALLGVGSGVAPWPGFLVRAAGRGRRRRRVLVVVFLRGAADGLNLVVPHFEDRYYASRPGIAIPRPGRAGGGGAIDLDGRFGLHPALAPLHRHWQRGRLAIVHAAGSPDSTRSHFDAQDFMETGTPGIKSTPDGWLNRTLTARSRAAARRPATEFHGVAIGAQLPRILQGEASALAIPNLGSFGIRGLHAERAQAGLSELYAAADDPLFTPTARATFDALRQLREADPTRHRPARGAKYPRHLFGRNLAQVSQLIRSDIGMEIAFVEFGGWDDHVSQGGVEGRFASRLRVLADGLDAFARDLGPRMDDVVVLTLSEFGRTLGENGARGTDHGHATAMLVLGGAVRGRRVVGRWPGLEPEQLYEGRDLALTTDFRDVAGVLLQQHLGVPDVKAVFPGFTPATEDRLRLIRR